MQLPNTPTLPRLLTRRGIAEIANVNRLTVSRLAAKGRIHPVAEIELGGETHPLFDADAAILVALALDNKPNPHHIPQVIA